MTREPLGNSEVSAPHTVCDPCAFCRQAIVRLRNVLITAMRRHPQSPHIPKSLIRRLCDEYERADKRCAICRKICIATTITDADIDHVLALISCISPLFGRFSTRSVSHSARFATLRILASELGTDRSEFDVASLRALLVWVEFGWGVGQCF